MVSLPFTEVERYDEMTAEGFRKKLCPPLRCERNRIVLPAAQVEHEAGMWVGYLPLIFKKTRALDLCVPESTFNHTPLQPWSFIQNDPKFVQMCGGKNGIHLCKIIWGGLQEREAGGLS